METPEINVFEAKERLEKGDFLLDVREQHEFDDVHISGSTLIPLSEFEERYDELPRGKNIVVQCRSGARSAKATDVLLEKGYKAVNMAGGILAWEEADLPVRYGD